jgi:ubiquinone/menaquinone biosynthesis C-methylase UbiE
MAALGAGRPFRELVLSAPTRSFALRSWLFAIDVDIASVRKGEVSLDRVHTTQRVASSAISLPRVIRTVSMDYDQTEIAAAYDKARALAPETARLWLDLLSAYIDPATTSLIADLGCGTGRFSDLLAAHFAVRVIGIDPSSKMIDQARRKPAVKNVTYQQGSAEAIPLADGCANLILMSQVYHHLNDPPAVARECHRVLRRAGFICIHNSTRELDFPQRHFFLGLDPLIESELSSQDEIQRVFIDAGFSMISHNILTQVLAPDWHSFVEKSALRANSFLARLSDRDFEQGMAELRSRGPTIDQDDPVTEEIAWFVFARNPMAVG